LPLDADDISDLYARHARRLVTFFARRTYDSEVEHLNRYDKKSFLSRRGTDASTLPSYVPRLIEVVGDQQRGGSNRRDDTPLRLLRDVSASHLLPHIQGITDAGRQHLPRDTWEAQRFIELLQRCGLWTAAAEFADEIVRAVPDDTEHAIQRDDLVGVLALCRAQEALADGRTVDALPALAEARAADKRRTAALAEQRYPWEVTE
jgi:hypothetical protein